MRPESRRRSEERDLLGAERVGVGVGVDLGVGVGGHFERPPRQGAALRHSTRRMGIARHSDRSSSTRYSPAAGSTPTIFPNLPIFELDR
jgi:hypothetical protein